VELRGLEPLDEIAPLLGPARDGDRARRRRAVAAEAIDRLDPFE
jgi:hypothetical protein